MKNVIAIQPFYLAQPLGSTDVTMQVRGLKDSRGNLITAMPSGVTELTITIEPRSTTNQEFVSGTGITDNGNGLVTITGLTRNLSPVDGSADLSDTVSHANNSECVVSNSPFSMRNVLTTNEDKTVTAVISFGASPTVPTGVNPTDAVNKSQLDTTVAGTVPASSTTVLGAVRVATDATKTLGTATMTIASPCVVTFNSHGLTANDTVRFTTTIALPTGIVAGTTYYVIATGLTVNTFQMSLTAGGSAVNTSGGQSGVHTLYRTTPYAVNDQDPRLPTQAENDAMAGTSGPPSNTNRFVTDLDTSTTIVALKVARYNTDGDLAVQRLIREIISRENLSPGNGVSLYPYQSDGGVLVDTVASCGATPGTGGNITVAANSNRKLILFASHTSAASAVTATAGGNSMTQIQGQTNPNNYAFYIDNPTPGSVTIALNATCSWICYSIYNAVAGAPENSSIVTSSSGALNLATIADGSMTITGCGAGQDNITGLALTGAGAYGGNTGTIGDATGRSIACHSGQVFPNAVTLGATLATGGFSMGCIVVSIAPVTAPTYGSVYLSSAATNAISQYVNKYQSFLGFSTSTTTVGNVARVAIAGATMTSTTMVGNVTQYLSNTPGQVSSVAGTNSKKVGQAINSSTINIVQVI